MVLWSSHGPLSMRTFICAGDRCGAHRMIVQSLPAALYHAGVYVQRTRDSSEQRAQGHNSRPQQEGEETPIEGHGDIDRNPGGNQ